jgi:hypothetical protein
MAQLVKTFNGLAIASVKTVAGLAIASVKTIKGVDNTAGGGVVYLVEENFEDTGTPTGWTVIAGTPNFDVATDPGEGSQSAQFDGSAATVSADHTAFANRGEAWGYFRAKFTSAFPGGGREIVRFQVDGSQSSGSEIRVTDSGGLLIVVGTTASTETVAKMSLDTWYDIFWYHKKGTGSDGIGWVAFSTDGSIGTGNNLSIRSNMNGTTDIDIARVTAQFSTTGPNWFVDRFLVHDSAISASP